VPLVDVLITGSGFARGLTGIDDIWRAGETILEMGPRVFVETAGERGSYTVTRQQRFHTPAHRVQVVDTTGAGDVYHGAYIVGLIRGWDPVRCAAFATAAAALKCGQLGGRAGIPSYEEVMAFMRERGQAPG
jgi:sugar/nucleoside kinase (ribokinase family)